MDASARTTQFLTRKIDVMSVYLSNELPQIEKRAGVTFNILKVSDFGLNLLGASLIVGNAFAEQNPETVKKLLRATARGYRDAMANPRWFRPMRRRESPSAGRRARIGRPISRC
jgi:NitT/TauT family transport system substrate-binding protein